VLLEEASDTSFQQRDTVSEIPKKVDRWAYEKTEALLREQIRNLKEENFYLRDQISLSRSLANKVEVPSERTYTAREPIRPTKVMSKFEMEAHEKEKYWKAEIARREAEAKGEAILEVDA
jgi:hypothetical protein